MVKMPSNEWIVLWLNYTNQENSKAYAMTTILGNLQSKTYSPSLTKLTSSDKSNDLNYQYFLAHIQTSTFWTFTG